MQLGAEGQVADREQCLAGPTGTTGPYMAPFGRGSSANRAEHQLDDPLLATLRQVEHAHVPSVAQYRGAVADRAHLGQPVRDKQDGATEGAPTAHHQEDPLGQVGGQRGSDLVQKQQLRLAGQGTSQVEHPQGGEGQIGDQLAQIDGPQIHLCQPTANRLDAGAGEAEVFEHRQVGGECRVLEHGGQTGTLGLGGGPEHYGALVHANRAAIRADHPG